MIQLFEALIEAAENNDFTLKSIDPRDKSYNETEDDLLYKEAYNKGITSMSRMYESTKDLLREARGQVRDEAHKAEYSDVRVNASIHTLSMNPTHKSSILVALEKAFCKVGETSDSENDAVDVAFTKYAKDFRVTLGIRDQLTMKDLMGESIRSDISLKFVRVNLENIITSINNLLDELYFSYNKLVLEMQQTKNTSDIELFTRMFELICKVVCSYSAAYMASVMELVRISRGHVTMHEATATSTNEENAKQYIKEMDKLIDEIRDFYDKFNYKEIITPRKKKEHKMYEYMLGALQRRYKLKVPMYKVVGTSKDVKDIVENKFIKKLETITKKYPNFCILSPTWDDDDDMFIYVTLREPFGDKEDREDREDQAKAMHEAAMTAAERKRLDNSQFGLPDVRKYPLNDPKHIKEAIKFFGYCDAKDKKTLASNIVKKTLELNSFGTIHVSPTHPNKKFFPEWFIGDCRDKGYSLQINKNKYTILNEKGKKVDWYTINDTKLLNESIIFDTEGKLY